MVRAYNPNQTPDAQEWLALDEQLRIDLVEAFHRAAKEKMPNVAAHAVFHAIVENQIAMHHSPVSRAMKRLAKQGLSRHDCIHAIAWVLACHLQTALATTVPDTLAPSLGAQYDAAVERLTAAGWRTQVEE